MATANNFDTATRSQACTLKVLTNMTAAKIQEITGIGERQQRRLVQKAKDRGWIPGRQLLDCHVDDAPRSGRPSKTDEATIEKGLANVRQNRAIRTHRLQQIADDAGVELGRETVRRILKAAGMKKVKRTTKPGLNQKQKDARLQWCLKHQNTYWRRVCFSDETSVVLGQRRVTDHVWRTAAEFNDPTCRRFRWKGFTTFMFRGCFSYDSKGPGFIWDADETPTEKAEAKKAIEQMNHEREPQLKREWELTTAGLNRMDLNRHGKKPSKPPVWKFDKKHGKLARDSRGGLDWCRVAIRCQRKVQPADCNRFPF